MPLRLGLNFSEDTKERITRTIGVIHHVAHYGWVPFVLYMGYTRSTPQPSLIKSNDFKMRGGPRWVAVLRKRDYSHLTNVFR